MPWWWKKDDKDWETQQEVDAIDGLIQDEEQFTEMDEMGLIPETPWGDTEDEHDAVNPPDDSGGGPKWLRWLKG